MGRDESIDAPVWNETVRAPRPVVPAGTIDADVAIVGGGLTGLSIAYHLLVRDPAARVVVLEAARLGAGASGRNTGMLGPGVAQNLLGLVRRVGAAHAEALYRETLRAVALVRELAATERIDCDLSMTGQIYWGRSSAGRRRLAAQAAWLNARQLPCEVLDDEALRRRVRLPGSNDRGRGLPAALWLPVAGILDPGKLVAGLARAAEARGARLFEASPVAELTGGADDRTVRLVLAGGSQVLAGQAVLATAGYTAALGRLRGRIIPLRLQALATEPIPAALLAQIGWAGREGIIEARRIFNYFRLSAGNRLIFGGGPPRPCPHGGARDETLPETARLALARSLYATFPGLARAEVRITHGWSGTIGYVVDGIPAIGRCREQPRVLHAVGWSGHGLALGVAAGSWTADLIAVGDVGRAPAGGLAWFRSAPPRVPCEPLHALAVRAGVGAMQLLDCVA